jgi:integrase
MPRQANKEGSVYYIKTRETWAYSFTDVDGKRKERRAKSESDARAQLRKALAARDAGESASRSPTLADFTETWLEAKRVANCRPRTLEAYRERLDYVLPGLGKLKLDKLAPHHLDALYDSLLTRKPRPLSPTTVLSIHLALHNLLTVARRRRLVGYVVTEMVEPPRAERYKATTLTIEQAAALINGARGHRHGPLFAFMLGTGCRFGEAVGLTWANVDLDRAEARIEQQVSRARVACGPRQVRGRTVTTKVAYLLGPVKTDAGRRKVFLPPFVVEALREQKRLIAELRLAAGKLWKPNDLVFPQRHGRLLQENHVLITWHRLLAALDLPRIRMHDLRHSKATLMADAGEEITTIQRTLGHARQSITADIYVGDTSTALRQAAERFGKLMEG